MKTIVAASVLALMASTALADRGRDSYGSADIEQVATGVQEALNEIKDVMSAVDVEQTAVNAANLVSLTSTGGVEEISQTVGVKYRSRFEQDAENKIDLDWGRHVMVKDITQSATNVVNSISIGAVDEEVEAARNQSNGLDLEKIEQDAYFDQWATNDLSEGKKLEDIAQSAVNAANLISISADVGDLDEIDQVAKGDQDAKNYIEFTEWLDGNELPTADTDPDDILNDVIPSTQSATNVANSVSVASVGRTLKQFSDVSQDAENVVNSEGRYSNIWDLKQTAVNAANLVSIGNIGGSLDIEQTAEVSQLASNFIDANGSIESVVQSATNVANSIGDLN